MQTFNLLKYVTDCSLLVGSESASAAVNHLAAALCEAQVTRRDLGRRERNCKPGKPTLRPGQEGMLRASVWLTEGLCQLWHCCHGSVLPDHHVHGSRVRSCARTWPETTVGPHGSTHICKATLLPSVTRRRSGRPCPRGTSCPAIKGQCQQHHSGS